jgi:hypothetical protein
VSAGAYLLDGRRFERRETPNDRRLYWWELGPREHTELARQNPGRQP